MKNCCGFGACYCCRGRASLEHIAQVMMETQDYVFVLDKEEKLMGVVSAIDVAKKILELMYS